MVARFLRVTRWELRKVAFHYIDEATAILAGRHDAITAFSKDNNISAEKVILPDY